MSQVNVTAIHYPVTPITPAVSPADILGPVQFFATAQDAKEEINRMVQVYLNTIPITDDDDTDVMLEWLWDTPEVFFNLNLDEEDDEEDDR